MNLYPENQMATDNLTELFHQIVLHTDRYGKPNNLDGSSLEMRLTRGKTNSTTYIKSYPSGFYEQVVKVWNDFELVFQAATVTRMPALKQGSKNIVVWKYTPEKWEDDFLKTKLKPPYT